MEKKELKPGSICDTSGQYKMRGPRGGISKTEVTLIEGKKVPPTDKPRQTYIIVDKTKHKR